MNLLTDDGLRRSAALSGSGNWTTWTLNLHSVTADCEAFVELEVSAPDGMVERASVLLDVATAATLAGQFLALAQQAQA